MATPLDITALETSFDLVAARREELVDRFYRRLFRDAPATRALFAHADMRAQKRALLGALVALRRSLRDLSSIAPFLADLGARPARYDVSAEHYPVVGAALLETMAEVGGAGWQPFFTSEWARAYQMVAHIMIDGAERSAAAA
jgi:nitric oxide dioxygenase